ncbi:hypothetical protein FQA39_LY02185 [Lamprigera yunnana]|nr:hypothetical protein FQA39_LY02185 [Lamprigera yunnana]
MEPWGKEKEGKTKEILRNDLDEAMEKRVLEERDWEDKKEWRRWPSEILAKVRSSITIRTPVEEETTDDNESDADIPLVKIP